jgi:hypothetical protein
MSAGFVYLSVNDANGTTRTVQFWSSDGTLSGVLTPAHLVLGDDTNSLMGSASDAVWDGSATSPTWTALKKYIATKLEAVRALLSTIATNTTGLATATNQGAGNTSLATIATNSATQATSSKQDTGNTSLASLVTAQGTSASGVPFPSGGAGLLGWLSGAYLYLTMINDNTSGLATEDGLDTANSTLDTIATNTTGGATAAKQDTGNTSLATIATNTTGAATSAKQDTGNTSLASIATNTTGAATAANQSTGNTSLATIAGLASQASPYLDTALSSTVQSIKSSAGKLLQLNFYNPNASIVWAQLFNVASGSVTLGTTTPVLSFPLPAEGWYDVPLPPSGMAFSTAISIAATTTAEGSSAPASAINVNGGFV